MSLYQKYSEILRHLYNLMNLTDNMNLKEDIKNNMINMISELCNIDRKNKELYLLLLEEFGLERIDNQVNYESKDEEMDKKEEKLKIINAKKSYNSKLKNKALTLFSFSNNKENSSLINDFLATGAYYLYKSGANNVKKLIEESGYRLNEEDNLIDVNGRIVKDEDLGRIRYNLIKKELSKINPDGLINFDYKKNRLTSILLNVPVLKKVNSKPVEFEITSIEENPEIKDMNKGMGVIK